MRYGDKGALVKAIQQSLIDRGYPLKRYGADGDLGGESWDQLEAFGKAEGGGWTPEVPDAVRFALGATPVAPPDIEPVPPDENSVVVEIVDLRSEQSDPSPKSKVSGGHTVLRAPRTVTGITLHQTGTPFGVSQQQINAADGDADLARQRRSLKVACHSMAWRKGYVVWTNNLDRYIYHGNGQNSATLGIEVEGRYAGLESKREKTTWGGEAQDLTKEVIMAGRAAVRLMVEEGRKLGMPIEYIYAHRQSSATRVSDPGEALWKAIVVEYAVPVLKLKTDPGRTWGDGKTVPTEWDPDGVGSY